MNYDWFIFITMDFSSINLYTSMAYFKLIMILKALSFIRPLCNAPLGHWARFSTRKTSEEELKSIMQVAMVSEKIIKMIES